MCECSPHVLVNSVLKYLANTLTPKFWTFPHLMSFILPSLHSDASSCLGTTFSCANSERKFTQKFFHQPEHLIYCL